MTDAARTDGHPTTDEYKPTSFYALPPKQFAMIKTSVILMMITMLMMQIMIVVKIK